MNRVCYKCGTNEDLRATRNICRTCDNNRRKEAYKKARQAVLDAGCSKCKSKTNYIKKGHTVCVVCEQAELPLKKCTRCGSTTNPFRKGRNICRPCNNALAKERAKIRATEPAEVTCIKCGLLKDNIRKGRRVCQDCINENNRTDNANKIKEPRKKWKQSEKFKAQRPIENHRTRVRNYLFGTGKCKELGCSRENLRKWIEFCFTENMSWDNYAIYWKIDHTIPITEIRDDLVHWTNIYPMKCKENKSKKSKMDNKI